MAEANSPADWRSLMKFGGITALVAMLLAPAEVIIGMLPGMNPALPHSALDWFALFRANGFLGLRDLGLINIAGVGLLVPTVLAIFAALRREREAWAALAALIFFLGVAVYLADNRAFAMLSLSSQYWSAASEPQKAALLAAGQAALAEGQSRSGLMLIEFACLSLSALMWREPAFGKITALAGIIGNALLMGVEVLLTLRGVLDRLGLAVAMAGGVAILLWYLLVGLRLLRAPRP